MKKIETLYRENPGAADYSRAYTANLVDILSRLDHQAVARVIEVLDRAYHQRKRIYFIGNGGSASTCGHFVNDLHAGSLRHGGGGFRAHDLAGNVSSLTAVANDLGYEHVFSSQLEGVLDAGDVVVAISASGNSPNLLRAVEYAHKCQAVTVGLLGFDGGALKGMCDHSVVVITEKGEYGPVEDIHMVLDHLIASYFCCLRNAKAGGKP
jgi:D-sedoheptulose 7-phosphate isomerase